MKLPFIYFRNSAYKRRLAEKKQGVTKRPAAQAERHGSYLRPAFSFAARLQLAEVFASRLKAKPAGSS
jgi:hypothetical protein